MKRMTVMLAALAATVAMASSVWGCNAADCDDYAPDAKDFIRLACASASECGDHHIDVRGLLRLACNAADCGDHHIDVRGLLRLACDGPNCEEDYRKELKDLREMSRVALAPKNLPLAAGAISKAMGPSAGEKQGAKPNHSPNDTAMQRLQKADPAQFPAITAFLNKRIPVDAKDSKGNTLLFYVAAQGDASAVQYLLSKGADPKFTNKNGCTPLSCAKAKGRKTVVSLLEKTGAK